MVVSGRTYTNAIYSATNYGGVVKVSSNGYYGTGSLLYDGSAILTAAHLFTDTTSPTNVRFELSDGSIQNISASSVLIHPDYDTNNDNNDLAIVFLNNHAPNEVDRYDIYRATDELTQNFTAVGYGVPGTGNVGEDQTVTEVERLKSTNTYDTLGDELKDALGSIMAWDPLKKSVLVADFDDGSQAHDALGNLVNIKKYRYRYNRRIDFSWR